MIEKWTTLASTMVLNSPWCRVRRDEVVLPNGTVVDDFYVVMRPDIALVLPITPDGSVIFVRQYRHGVGEILLELPAGGFDPEAEDAEVAVLRELREETGYTSDRLTKLAVLYDNPVKDTNRIHLFRAENVWQVGEQSLDITEAIDVVPIPIHEIPARIASGNVCVAGTVAALFLGLELYNPELLR